MVLLSDVSLSFPAAAAEKHQKQQFRVTFVKVAGKTESQMKEIKEKLVLLEYLHDFTVDACSHLLMLKCRVI